MRRIQIIGSMTCFLALFLSLGVKSVQAIPPPLFQTAEIRVDDNHPILMRKYENGQVTLSLHVVVPYCTAFHSLVLDEEPGERPTFQAKLIAGLPCAYIYPQPMPRVVEVIQTIDIGRSLEFSLMSTKGMFVFRLVQGLVLEEVARAVQKVPQELPQF